jgi:hypothetical protein
VNNKKKKEKRKFPAFDRAVFFFFYDSRNAVCSLCKKQVTGYIFFRFVKTKLLAEIIRINSH